jgi:hypothetical protein
VSPNWQGSAPKTKFDIMIDVGTYPTICDRTDGASRKSKPQSDRLLGPHRGNLQLTIAAGRATGGGYPVGKYEAEMRGAPPGDKM